jgi:hypothetical protein
MTLAYEQCPILAELPLVTEGFIYVGTPVGPLPYIRNFMTERLTALKAEFLNLLSYPYPHDFMLFVRYCCNMKIAHLLRHLIPQILDYAQRVGAIIDQLNDDYYDLRLQSQASRSLHDIPANLPYLSEAQMAQLARVQFRSLPSDGGLDLLPMVKWTSLPSTLLTFAISARFSKKVSLGLTFLRSFNTLPAPVFSPNPFTRPKQHSSSERLFL